MSPSLGFLTELFKNKQTDNHLMSPLLQFSNHLRPLRQTGAEDCLALKLSSFLSQCEIPAGIPECQARFLSSVINAAHGCLPVSRKPRRSGPVPGTPAGGDRALQSNRSLSRVQQLQAGEGHSRPERMGKVREDLTWKEMLMWAQSRGQGCPRPGSRMSSIRPTVC